ncbi:MAG: 5-formyltetrahydrofolate cyclo-ligase [Gammaproteobacteria bacterium]|nr:5-formyltetrahydrofolate cyclo-ligase [Gammaproteobacteria bacterium]
MKQSQTPLNRDFLRQQMIQRRLKLTPAQQQHSALALQKQLFQSAEVINSQHIAAYWSVRGEIETAAILRHAEKLGKNLYLPLLTDDHQLHFAPYQHNSPMQANQFRIPEPVVTNEQLIKAENLDLVLVPLLAFDNKGNRLGMGGGYYDRTFEFKQNNKQGKKPLLVGLAHGFQQVETLEAEPWDVPLDFVVTA